MMADPPMIAQYLVIKAEHRDALLFYRTGDFYAALLEDAAAVAKALGMVVTRQGNHTGENIAMCAVPVYRAGGDFLTLTALGHTVAVCDQVEEPAEPRGRRSGSTIALVHVITPEDSHA